MVIVHDFSACVGIGRAHILHDFFHSPTTRAARAGDIKADPVTEHTTAKLRLCFDTSRLRNCDNTCNREKQKSFSSRS